MENAAALGRRFKEGLEQIARENRDCVKEVRALGLMIGIEYKYEFIGALMSDCLVKQGVWAVYSTNSPQVMRFQITTAASLDELDEILRRISAAAKVMRRYLILLLPLAKVPPIRKLLDNAHLQIVTFNWVRNLEERILRFTARRAWLRHPRPLRAAFQRLRMLVKSTPSSL